MLSLLSMLTNTHWVSCHSPGQLQIVNCRKNLLTTLTRYAIMYRARGCSSAGRARQSHCRGQGFEPPHLHRTVSRTILLFDEIALQIAKSCGIVYVTVST